MSRDYVIRLDHVSKTYRLGQLGGRALREDLRTRFGRSRDASDQKQGKTINALDDVSLQVAPGEALGIIGRNGSGKSTLLKLITGITTPSRGELEVYGRITSMLEIGTGFHRELTGRENVFMNGAILGMSRKEIRARMDDIIAFSEIGRFMDTPVKRYSSGMYVKLAFSVAAHLNSEILVMDEVLAVGDYRFRKKCLERMQEAHQDGRTILYVSHNMNTIRRICTRCIVMDEGRITYSGEPGDAIARYMAYSEEYRTEDDLDSIPRRSETWKNTAKLTRVELPGKEIPEFYCGEEIRLRLSFRNLSTKPEICLRVELWTTDDLPQGSYLAMDLACGACGEETVYDVTLRTDQVAPGEYKMKYTLFYVEEDGFCRNADSVTGLFFRLLPDPAAPPLQWDASHWGSVRLTGIETRRL